MNVFLLKDIVQVGLKNEIIKVSSGYAKNFLFPNKFAVEVTKANENTYKSKIKTVQDRAAVIETTSSLLGNQISQLTLKLKKTMHDGDKLYAAIKPNEVVDLLKDKNISISKSQVVFNKPIKSKGSYLVTVKLSSKIKPQFTLQIVA